MASLTPDCYPEEVNAAPPPFPAYSGDGPFVFVSYAHANSSLVFQELVRMDGWGLKIWYDEGIAAGSEWTDVIAQAIQDCSLFLYFITPAAVTSPHCRREVSFAINTCLKPFVSVFLEPTRVASIHPGTAMMIENVQSILKYEVSELRYETKLQKAIVAHVPGFRPTHALTATQNLAAPLKQHTQHLVSPTAVPHLTTSSISCKVAPSPNATQSLPPKSSTQSLLSLLSPQAAEVLTTKHHTQQLPKYDVLQPLRPAKNSTQRLGCSELAPPPPAPESPPATPATVTVRQSLPKILHALAGQHRPIDKFMGLKDRGDTEEGLLQELDCLHLPLSPNLVTAISEALERHLGVTAKLYVREGEREHQDSGPFIRQLAARLEDPNQRIDFLKQCARALRGFSS